ncbi:MAG: hypothetical protein AB1656_20915 [Candidatus Omnitrophota bacterium]
MIGTILPKRHSQDGGFTLMEVLLASVMYAIVVGAVYTVFYGALRLREKAYDAFEKALPKDYALSIVKRDLSGLMPPGGVLAGSTIGEKIDDGGMRRDRLEFYTSSGVITADSPWGDIQKVEYYLADPEFTDGGEGFDLVRAVTRNLLPSTEPEVEESRLLTGAASLAFLYYDGTDWLDSWDAVSESSTEQSTTTEESTTDSTASQDEETTLLAIRLRVDFLQPRDADRLTRPIDWVIPVIVEKTPQSSQSTTQSSTEDAGGQQDTGGGTGGLPGGQPSGTGGQPGGARMGQ